ncbi:MAG: hypothetical protein E7311_06875 [Clostridiales bacterium]|nr:hypothetical protein [Clostridiales bacterium]
MKLFVLYFIGSVFGCIVETIYAIIKTGYFQIRQGLIYGPFIPIYGIGTILFYIILLITKKPANIFILSIIMGGALEFICSFIQEKVFGSVSWDYSNTFLNFAGRTNLQYSIYWGFIGLLFLKLFPYVSKIDLLTSDMKWRIVIYISIIFTIINIVISSMACIRQYARQKNIPPRNKIELFLDNHYPDKYLDKIYNNKKWVKTD